MLEFKPGTRALKAYVAGSFLFILLALPFIPMFECPHCHGDGRLPTTKKWGQEGATFLDAVATTCEVCRNNDSADVSLFQLWRYGKKQ